ncbi:MAG: 2-amino-4-hydroxy-6-hydroxymethyldihydropteridine diphosphokinase [Flavobacteriia bacterium]|nr:MAG: 2-amino-4-hydroxy-6-hydroxymethyldihydropteridine diphosphokinase [Flavobacteriia bacterium]
MKIVRNTYLSLGTNQGEKLQNLQDAVDLIAKKAGRIGKISSVYKTAAWGFEGSDFLNICIGLITEMEPEELMITLLEIERSLGRLRKGSGNYSSRKIDIDLLLFENKIINTKDLIVPHPRMLDRKFVLVPLAEIIPDTIHPVAKATISQCLKACTDNTEVFLTDLKIRQSKSLIEKYNYIAIEGNIGSGKTSLAHMFSEDFNAKLVLERFADNPFLPKFYKDQERYAFPLEMSFLADRYHQLSNDLSQFDLFKNFIVSDYYIFKSLIFAQVTLPSDEFKLYRKMFDLLYKEITKPDIYIYLNQDIDRLISNIKKRGRAYEQNISPEYLKNIQQAYTNFIKSEKDLNTLIIDATELDFVNRPEDYQLIIEKILEKD